MTLANEVMQWSLVAAFVCVALSQLGAMVRLVIGPSTGDRILALDTMVVNAIGLIVLLGVAQGTGIYFEASLIIAMLGVGVSMENVGLVESIVDFIAPFLVPLSPLFALGVVYILSSMLTEIVTNNAVAVIVTPVAIGLATGLGVDPRPFVVAVMFAASASFLTPIGYQTNTLVYSAGGYKFFDFVRIGALINIVVFIVSMTMIPIICPF